MVKVVKKLVDVKRDWNWYQKRPINVKAVELDETVEIHTREGVLKGYSGDFLIQGVEGEIYLCAKHIFNKTYKKIK